MLLLHVQDVGPRGRSKLTSKGGHIGLGVLAFLVKRVALHVHALQSLDELLSLGLVLGFVARQELGGHFQHRAFQVQVHFFDGLGGQFRPIELQHRIGVLRQSAGGQHKKAYEFIHELFSGSNRLT